ncbi:MAG: efflux RND transporter periplasmic adaptor subunit [Bacteroidetes bacterium]|nr:efflux RND transporter periplasmic adaptor subunit [Bacteroidota bacterium]
MTMQKRNILFFLVPVLLFTACRNTEEKDLASKKKQLAEYKSNLKELTANIETLEKQISKMDTAFLIEKKSKRVTVEELKKQDFKHYIEVQGVVDAEENITALNQQPGIVSAIYVKVGDRVSKGQLLGITQTTAAIEDQLKSAQAQTSLAVTAFEKQKNLWEQKIGSEIQFLQAKTQKEAAERGVDGLKKQLEMTKIIAPINGTVDAVNLRVGDMAAPSQLMPGIRIINNESLKVKAKLADSDFGKIRQGDKVEIEFPDINKTVEASVHYVSKTIDPRSRTFGVEIKLPNDQNEYAANMIAKLKINDVVMKDVLIIPSNVIQRSSEGEYILAAQTENGIKRAYKKSVVPGLSYNGRTVVTKGMEEGNQIITFGYSEVVDGQKIDY